jgi:hypothetical protein
MLSLVYFLAAVEMDENGASVITGETSKLFGYNMRDLLLLGGMVLVLAVTLFLFAYLTRKNRRETIALANTRPIYRDAPEEDSERRRYRKKRRRRSHPEFLPRNPTLQETGGLPPLRPEEKPAEPTQ